VESQEKWNRKHLDRLANQDEPIVNERLKKLVPGIEPGRAIDLACGLGANSLYLANLGFEVTAVDQSEVALNHVRNQAEKAGLNFDPVLADISDPSNLKVELEEFDFAVITYYLNRSLFPLVKNMVKIGGYLFMETFYEADNGGKQQISSQYKLASNELLEEFKGWSIIFFQENETEGIQTIFCQKKGS
jgi:tellurite methyltransferase